MWFFCRKEKKTLKKGNENSKCPLNLLLTNLNFNREDKKLEDVSCRRTIFILVILVWNLLLIKILTATLQIAVQSGKKWQNSALYFLRTWKIQILLVSNVDNYCIFQHRCTENINTPFAHTVHWAFFFFNDVYILWFSYQHIWDTFFWLCRYRPMG